MSIPRPFLTPRLIRATRTGCIFCLALVLLHYVGILGDPPPTLERLALYLLCGAAAAVLHGAGEWLLARRAQGSGS